MHAIMGENARSEALGPNKIMSLQVLEGRSDFKTILQKPILVSSVA
jgi:hypothetical protein